MFRIGIDTGGTFTDFVLLDEETGAIETMKVPSTPSEPARAIHAGLGQLENSERAEHIIVGTTVATNSVIERRGPRVLFVTNAGFEDVPFIGRLDKERLYDLHWQKPRPLVRRHDCLGVGGRIGHRGEVLEELLPESLATLEQKLSSLASENVTIAVSFLFSYLRPEHERAAAATVRTALPDAAISLSHEVSPVWREYERSSTTIADAYVKPVIGSYVEGVGNVLREDLAVTRWNMLASNGGYLRADQAGRQPAQLLLSGLAGGVIGARFFAESARRPSVFTLDMGGTSCDIGLVMDGAQQYAGDFQLSWGLPVSIPCVAVDTIGAGGGSIAWIDKGGLLRVGPQSAGAEPGPVAYGKDGVDPTLTDANLTLGRLDPAYFLGGVMRLDGEAARAALGQLGNDLGLSREAAALAAVRTADENMANAIRLIAVERGLDPRNFALIAFGGAGPLHARAVAERLDMGTVLVPPHPGLCSAFGSAIAQARVDRVQTYYAHSEGVHVEDLARVERGLCSDTVAELRRSVDVDEPLIQRSADMRYAGQNYELEVPLPAGDLDRNRWDELLARFEAEHVRQYGFALHGEAVELINLRVTALRPDELPTLAPPTGSPGAKPASVRPVWFGPEAPVECPIYKREDLAAGTEFRGPAVIEEPDSTTLVHAGDQLLVHPSGVLLLTLEHNS
jgi:N-methylhydantoinase A